MHVDTEPFPMNMNGFDDKKVLVQPSTADKVKVKRSSSVTYERLMKSPRFLA
jgi:hypothetical protein